LSHLKRDLWRPSREEAYLSHIWWRRSRGQYCNIGPRRRARSEVGVQKEIYIYIHQPHSSCGQITVAAGHVRPAVLSTTRRSPTVSMYVNVRVHVHRSTGAQSQPVVRT